MESIVKEAKELRTESIAFNSESRDVGIEDMEFELGGEYAWDTEVWNKRKDRPRVSINNVSTKKHRLANDLRDLNPEIKVIAKHDDYEKQAEVRNAKIKEIQEASCAETIYDACFCQGLSAGYSFMRVVTEYAGPKSFQQQIRLANINNNLSVHYDFNHKNPGYIDMEWGMVEGKMLRQKFIDEHGDKQMGNWDTDAFRDDNSGEYIYTNEFYKIEKKPKKLLQLYDGQGNELIGYKDEVKIVDALGYEIEGEKIWHVVDERMSYESHLHWYLMNGDDVIEDRTMLGNYIPIIPYEGRVIWIRGKKYLISFIRNLKEPAKLKNYGKSLEVELVALQPLNTITAPMESIEEYMDYYNNANNTAYPVLPFDHKDKKGDQFQFPPKREVYQGPSNQLAGLFQSYDKDLLDISGMPDDSLGSPSQMRLPGAIELKNNQGNHNNFDFMDNFITRTLNYAGIVMNNLITEVYNEKGEMQIEKNGQRETVKLNQEDGIDLTDGTEQLQVKTVVGASSKTERDEAVKIISDLIGKVPGMESTAFVMVENMDNLKNKDDIVKILKAQLPPHVQQALDSDESVVAVENMQLKQQVEQITAQYEQASELIKSMQIDYKKAMDVQGLKSETEIKKAAMNNATALTKQDMITNEKMMSQVLSGFQDMKKQLSGLTEKRDTLTIEGQNGTE